MKRLIMGRRAVSGAAAVAAIGLASTAMAVTSSFQFTATQNDSSPFSIISFSVVGQGSIDSNANITDPVVGIPDVVLNFYDANPQISGSFAYDTNASTLFGNGTSFNTYQGTHLTVDLNDPDTGAFQVQQSPTFVTVSTFSGNSSISVNTNFSPLTGGPNPFELDNANPDTVTVDLKADTNLAGFLPAELEAMPIRVTLPDTFTFEFFSVTFTDNDGTATDGLALPATLDLADFETKGINFQWTGSQVNFEVNEEDYADTDSFNLAANWVADNLTAINYRLGSNYTVTGLSGGPGEGTVPEVPFLPGDVTTPEGGFVFEETVDDVNIWWFDPIVAVGYEYELLSGPLFAGVEVQAVGADTEFLISSAYFSDVLLTAGVFFDFTAYSALGIDAFTITGIDPGEGLDPNDPLAFVTGLTFIEAGDVNFTMTPITVDTDPPSTGGAVPEPATTVLSAMGLLALAGGCRRRR